MLHATRMRQPCFRRHDGPVLHSAIGELLRQGVCVKESSKAKQAAQVPEVPEVACVLHKQPMSMSQAACRLLAVLEADTSGIWFLPIP